MKPHYRLHCGYTMHTPPRLVWWVRRLDKYRFRSGNCEQTASSAIHSARAAGL